jgi:hypothetical protein
MARASPLFGRRQHRWGKTLRHLEAVAYSGEALRQDALRVVQCLHRVESALAVRAVFAAIRDR